jgi:biotin carboxyl carrier protein
MARTYTLAIADRITEAEVSESEEEGAVHVRIGAATHRVSLDPIDDGGRLFSLLVDGHSYAVYAHGSGGAYQLLVDNELFEVQVKRGHGGDRLAQAATAAGPRLVRSPMTGIVSSVEVKDGQEVELGTVLLILESMKMNNELRAETAGRVDQIAVAAGQRVERGALLVRLSPRVTPDA